MFRFLATISATATDLTSSDSVARFGSSGGTVSDPVMSTAVTRTFALDS